MRLLRPSLVSGAAAAAAVHLGFVALVLLAAWSGPDSEDDAWIRSSAWIMGHVVPWVVLGTFASAFCGTALMCGLRRIRLAVPVGLSVAAFVAMLLMLRWGWNEVYPSTKLSSLPVIALVSDCGVAIVIALLLAWVPIWLWWKAIRIAL
jgi:hypothetical protein